MAITDRIVSQAKTWGVMLAWAVCAVFASAPAWAQAPLEGPPPAEQGAPESQRQAQGQPPPQTQTPALRFDLTGYVVAAGDRLQLRVAGEDSLTTAAAVDAAGRVDLPLIGALAAAGRTVAALEDAVEAALRDGFLNNPSVSIDVLSLPPVTVVGEVQIPGEYSYRGDLTLMNIVSGAGGFTTMANQTRVAIRASGAQAAVEMPLAAATQLAPGDEIRFLKSAFYILGEVNNPGEYRFTEGLTVMAAVATARGFTNRANQTRVLIQRAGESAERAVRLTPDLRVQAGDTLRIAERYF